MTYKRGIINLVPLFYLHMDDKQLPQDFEAACSVCGTRYKNHVGSTECCGALAYVVEDGKVTDEATIFMGDKNGIRPTTINIPRDEKTGHDKTD